MAAKEKKILQEIVERAEDYEARQAAFFSEIGEWSDMYHVRPPKRADNTFSNPRQTEYFRAVNAVGTLAHRMQTASDPPFEVRSVQLDANYDDMDLLRHTWETQLRWARWRANHLRACRFAPAFGTVICQEDYRVMGVSAFGRRIPVTTMVPRVMDQVFFDVAATSFDECDWVETVDITSPAALMALAKEAELSNVPWNPKALEAAAKEQADEKKTNWRVLDRIRRYGFSVDEGLSKKRELLMFYGKLESMNDGVEYVAAVINRKFLVRFHANNFQHGRRPFRLAKWVDFSGLTGLGVGTLAPQHRQMDANLQKVQDLLSFGSYNMWTRKKNSIADEDMVIRPLQVVDVDNHDDLRPVVPNLGAARDLLSLDEILKQGFRAASLASDTLQGLASDATATSAALSQNESLRAVSVIAENMADPLVREHLESLHANNVQNIDAPFNIDRAGIATRVYPKNLRIDVEIKAKVVTDKDFQPKRLEKLIQVLQILTSTKSEHPDQANISVLPIVKQIAFGLEVNPNELITNPQAIPGMGAPAMMDAGAMLGLGGIGAGPTGGVGPVSTPVGPVLAS